MASGSNSLIFVDHTYKYNAAIEEVKKIIIKKELSDPLYYMGIRANLGAFQKDINVLWDLAIHDLSIIQYLFPEYKPISVSCNMGNPLNYGKPNISALHINYTNGFSANIFSSWLSPVKIRLSHFGFRNSTVVFDENEPSEKIKIYDQTFLPLDNRISLEEQRVSYRVGNMHSPKIPNFESLKSAIEDFVTGIINPEILLRNEIEFNDELLAVLSSAERSYKDGGAHIKVDFN
jgi:predicted dehydrogenase